MTDILAKGVDYSTRPQNWGAFFDALAAAGYTVLGRYLSSYVKGLTGGELASIMEHGFEIFPYFETDPKAPLGGFDTGRSHANQAIYWLQKLGLPPDLPVCYAVDFDASTSELQGPVRRYFDGVRVVVPVSQVGVYGGYYTVKYVMEQGLASWAVQTEAWSYLDKEGRVSEKGVLTWRPEAAVHQWTTHAYAHSLPRGVVYVNGVQLDVLDVVASIPTYPKGVTDMTPEQFEVVKQMKDLLFDMRYTVGTNSSFREAINNALLAEEWELAKTLNDEAWSKGIVTGLPKGWSHAG